MVWSTCKLIKYTQDKEERPLTGLIDRICGHRDLATRIDDRPFGFPFDREIGFDLYQDHR